MGDCAAPPEGNPWPWSPSGGVRTQTSEGAGRLERKRLPAAHLGKVRLRNSLMKSWLPFCTGFTSGVCPGPCLCQVRFFFTAGEQEAGHHPQPPPRASRDPAARAATVNAARLRPLRGKELGVPCPWPTQPPLPLRTPSCHRVRSPRPPRP